MLWISLSSTYWLNREQPRRRISSFEVDSEASIAEWELGAPREVEASIEVSKDGM